MTTLATLLLWPSKRGSIPTIPVTQLPLSFLRRHRLILIPSILVILAAQAVGLAVKAESLPILSAITILIFGMPHGAFDVALVSRNWPIDSVALRARFIVEYIGVAAFVVLFWSYFPGESLCAFLALSALHFSEDWKDELTAFGRLVIGASLLCFPALFHQQSVQGIFEWLVPASDAILLSTGLHTLALGMLPLVAVVLARAVRPAPIAVLEVAAILALAVVLTPLTFFVVYFCGLHSIRHLMHVREALPALRGGSMVSLALPYAAAAAIAIVMASLWSSLPLGMALIGSLFVGLAALTVPHMLLVGHD